MKLHWDGDTSCYTQLRHFFRISPCLPSRERPALLTIISEQAKGKQHDPLKKKERKKKKIRLWRQTLIVFCQMLHHIGKVRKKLSAIKNTVLWGSKSTRDVDPHFDTSQNSDSPFTTLYIWVGQIWKALPRKDDSQQRLCCSVWHAVLNTRIISVFPKRREVFIRFLTEMFEQVKE